MSTYRHILCMYRAALTYADACWRMLTSAYVSIRQHTSAYVSKSFETDTECDMCRHDTECDTCRTHLTTTCVVVVVRRRCIHGSSRYPYSRRQHTSAYVSIRKRMLTYAVYIVALDIPTADVSIRQHTYADVCCVCGRMLTYADVCWPIHSSARDTYSRCIVVRGR
jgi:hypothetical protein